MAQSKDQFTIADVSNRFKVRKENNQHTVLVLGSRTSGLFRSKKLYETLKLYGDPSFENLSRNKQFSECHRLLTRRDWPSFSVADIDSILTEALREIDIIDADIYLAELIRLELFDTIITTSMDNTLENALDFVGMKEMHGFEVFSLRADIKKEKLRSDKKVSCRLIKVFGELRTREYTIKRSGYLSQYIDIREVLENSLARDIIAIGLDPVWDEEIYRTFQLEGGSFWLVGEDALSEDSPLFHVGDARGIKHFSAEEGNYHYFMRELHEQFFSRTPLQFLSDYPLDGSILKELHRLRYEVRTLREEIQKSQKLF